MKIKSFLIIIYTLVGFFISIISSFLTYVIIGKPIGMPMVIQIIFVVIFLTPVIGIISFILGRYLSKKFNFIKNRLESIKNENYTKNNSHNTITELNEINNNINYLSNQLEHLIKDLKLSNQDLSSLLVSMAHDIKTPITIINGYIEELEDGIIDKQNQTKAFSHMKEETKFLNELTVDALEFITSKQNNKTDLKKIMLNLLNNAIKHTKNGYIKVYNIDSIIAFENSGEMIKEEFKNKIFEPFFTIDKSKNRKKSGFGLGLSIVRNLAKSNNYKCTLHSSDTNKTVFYLISTIHTTKA